MPRLARISERLSTGLLHFSVAFFLLFSTSAAFAQPDGEKLFKGNCASCHKPDKDMTGPALKGAKARWEGKGDIYAWVKNSQAYIKTGNAYAKSLFDKWQAQMTAQTLTNEEIDAVLAYADAYVPPPKKEDVVDNGPKEDAGSNGWTWLIVLALLFAVVALSLGGVRRSLNNAVREAEGLEPEADLPRIKRFRKWAWEHKVFMSFAGLFVFVWLILVGWDALWTVGVYGGDEVPHYKPEQPIKFNHTIHAGKADKGNLAINCQYCHSGAEKSKHAGIPSANVCMNCHKAVSESARNPWSTEEIKKIYDATGWDGKAFTGPEKPIRWVKVHNLPDHAYFNHAQHVAVGKLECQECHGPIDEQMDQAEQWAPLTMGWCINCHNQKEVKMAGNGYYDEIMARLHDNEKLGHKELKQYLEDDKITVRELGGWECAKCHY